MKYTRIRLFFVLLTVLVAGSCGDDSYLQQGTTEDAILPIGDVEVHPLGDVFKVAFTSPVAWKMNFDYYPDDESGWFSILPTSVTGKAGTTVVTFTVDPNVSIDRNCTVRFFNTEGSREKLKEFVISQDRAYLTVSEENIDFGWRKSEGEKSFDVETNLEWDYEVVGTDSTSFSVDIMGVVNKDGTKESGNAEDNAKVNVKVNAKAPNFGTQDYEAEITIKPVKRNNKGEKIESDKLDSKVRKALDGLTRTIKVSQDYLIFYVDNKPDTLSFSELGDTYVSDPSNVVPEYEHAKCSIEVVSEADWEWDVADSLTTEWGVEIAETNSIDFKHNERDCKKTTLEIKMSNPNPGEGPRTSNFVLYVIDDEKKEACDTIRIKQNAYEFSCDLKDDGEDKNTDTSFNNSGELKKIVVTTKGPWKADVDNNNEWLDLSKIEGVGQDTIEVSTKGQNLLFRDLEANVTISSGLNELEKPLMFTQEKFVFDVDWKFDESISRLDTTSHYVVVNSSGPWILEFENPEDDWVKLDKYEGKPGVDSISVNAKTWNPDTTSRSQKMTVLSTLHRDEEKLQENESFFCKDFVQDPHRFHMLYDKGPDEVDVDEQEINIEAYGKGGIKFPFDMKCSAPWGIEIKAPKSCDWLKFSTMSQDDGKYIPVEMAVSNNVSDGWDKPRTAEVELSCDRMGNSTIFDYKTFKVIQDAFVFKINKPEGESYERDALSTDKMKVIVECTDSAEWSIVPDRNWIKVDNGTYKGSADGEFTFTANDGLEPREGKVFVKSNVVDKSDTIDVKQGAYVFDTTSVELHDFAELSPKPKEVPFVCMGSWDWEVVEGPSKEEWSCDYSKDEDRNYGYILQIAPPANTDTTRKDYKIKIVSKIGGHEKHISVKQNPFTWEITPSKNIRTDNVLKVDALGGEDSVSLICSGSWKASADSAYVTVSPEEGKEGEGKVEVKVTVEPNYTTSQRTAKVTVSSDDNLNLKYELSVLQADYVFKVDTLFTEISYEGGRVVAVRCSERPEMSMPEGVDWLEESYSADRMFFVTAKENTKSSPRLAEVTVYSPNVSKNPAFTKTFTITQDAAPAQEPAE